VPDLVGVFGKLESARAQFTIVVEQADSTLVACAETARKLTAGAHPRWRRVGNGLPSVILDGGG